MENEKKEEGFSYTSPELQRKNALKVLGIEVIIILIIVVLIFFALSYFGIFKIGDLIKEFEPNQHLLQNNATGTKQIKPPTVTDTNNKAKVSVSSNIPTYNLILVHPQEFNEFMSIIGLWGYQPITQGAVQSPIKSVSILLTDKVQPDNQFKAEKTGIYMSADIDSRNGEVQVVAYLSNDVLIQEEGRRGRFFDQLVITSLYRFVHQSTGSNNTLIDKNLQLIYAEMGSKKITFFDIKSS